MSEEKKTPLTGIHEDTTESSAMPNSTKAQVEKRAEKAEEGKIRAYFVRLFGKYDFSNERQFIVFVKWLIFIVLLTVELIIFIEQLNDFMHQRSSFGAFIGLIAIEVFLTVAESLKLFVVKGNKRMVFHVFAALSACGTMFVTNGAYPLVIYMLLLTEFYWNTEHSRQSLLMMLVAIPLYAACYAIQLSLSINVFVNVLSLLRDSLGFTLAFVVHFIVLQIALAFYRQYLRLRRTLAELDESKKELEKAYAVAVEVAALEERQRIAKDIHDTAGHSLTTVIMQTEAAKRIVESNPEEAKGKIIAANLQAKHALEELRTGVHLLSGQSEGQTLKGALEHILHESSDGTGIKIRSAIDDVNVSQTKFRFICNTLKEGISNGLRHGGATAFWFELKQVDGKLSFLLSDNGSGLGGRELTLGFGLRAMQERARALGGEVQFISEEDEGFEIHLTLQTDEEE